MLFKLIRSFLRGQVHASTVDEVREHIAQGNYKAAEDCSSKLSTRQPDRDACMQCLQAEMLFRQGNDVAAEEMYKRVLLSAPAFAEAHYGHLAYTDGDRQFRVADLAGLVDRAQATGSPVVIGYRLKRADPPLRLIYAALYRVANRVWFGLSVRDVDCAAKLFRRDALRGISVHSDGAFFSAELLIRLRLAGVNIAEVGVPHYPRTAGSPTGARISVITRAVRDFWSLRIGLWVNRTKTLARGRTLLSK